MRHWKKTLRLRRHASSWLPIATICAVSLQGCASVKPIFEKAAQCGGEIVSQLLIDLDDAIRRDSPKASSRISEDTKLEVRSFIRDYGVAAVRCAIKQLISGAVTRRDMPVTYRKKLEDAGRWLEAHEQSWKQYQLSHL